MSTEAAFLAAILDDPDDDAPRLIYADWLDEQGRGERAEFIKVQCTLAEMGDDGLPVAHDRGNCCCDLCRLRRRERELLDAKVTSRPDGDANCAEGWSGGTRKRHWGIAAFKSLERTGLLYKDFSTDKQRLEFEFRRGFVHSITCTAADWLKHAAAILAAQPIEQVTFSVMPTDDELIEMDAAVKHGNPSIWTMRRWPDIAFALPPEQHGRIFTLPADVGSPESVARSLEGMRQAGERLAIEREEAILRSMGIPIDRRP